MLISHLHSDHVNHCAVACCARHDVPIHLHRGNLDGYARKVLPRAPAKAPVRPFTEGETFSIGGITVRPFRVPHDACGVTCGFSFTAADGSRDIRVTMATDLGHNGNGLFEEFIDSDLILIEANYDEEMLTGAGGSTRTASGRTWDIFPTSRRESFSSASSRKAAKSPRPSSCAT